MGQISQTFLEKNYPDMWVALDSNQTRVISADRDPEKVICAIKAQDTKHNEAPHSMARTMARSVIPY